MSGRRPPMFLATDRRMMQLSAAVRERRRQQRLAYTFDPGLQLADRLSCPGVVVVERRDEDQGRGEALIVSRTMPCTEHVHAFPAPTGEPTIPQGWSL